MTEMFVQREREFSTCRYVSILRRSSNVQPRTFDAGEVHIVSSRVVARDFPLGRWLSTWNGSDNEGMGPLFHCLWWDIYEDGWRLCQFGDVSG